MLWGHALSGWELHGLLIWDGWIPCGLVEQAEGPLGR